MDTHGRVFYIDHWNHTTTWQKPTLSSLSLANEDGTELDSQICQSGSSGDAAPDGRVFGQQARPTSSNLIHTQRNRLQLDKRYQSIQRTMMMADRGPSCTVLGASPHLAGFVPGGVDPSGAGMNPPDHVVVDHQDPLLSDLVATAAAEAAAVATSTTEWQREVLARGPVVQFIRRQDFVARVQNSDHPAALLINRPSVRHMISRIKRDALIFERYQHNRDLVALINAFADKSKDLPPGWEAKLDHNGKVRVAASLLSLPLYVQNMLQQNETN